MNYHIAKNGAQLGQMPEEEVMRRLQSGELSTNDLCWTDGMAEWQPLGVKFHVPVAASAPPAMAGINPYAAPASNVLRAPGVGLEPANRGTRLAAAFLEGLIFMVAALPMIFGGMMAGLSDNIAPSADGNMAFSGFSVLLTGLSVLLILGLLIFQLVMLVTRGQSIGKRLLGIRIVTCPNGDLPGGVKAILLRGLVPGIIGAIPILGPLFSIVNIGFIFREDRRCIHDLIASTQVVKGQPPH